MAPITTKFSESQRFNQPWLWVILIVIYVSPLIPNLSTILDEGFGAAFSIGILNHVITIGLVIILFLWMRLKTDFTAQGIHVHYLPFFKKEFAWQDIEQVEIVHYSFGDVLGWGIRVSSRLGTVYNVRGYEGIAVTLKNGKKYLIGTQQAETLKNYMNKGE